MKRIEYKVTSWNKIILPDEVNLYEVFLNMKKFEDPLSVCYDDKLKSLPVNKFCEFERITEREKYIKSPNENYGDPTFKVIDNEETVYCNSKYSIKNVRDVIYFSVNEVCSLLKSKGALTDDIYQELMQLGATKQKRELN